MPGMEASPDAGEPTTEGADEGVYISPARQQLIGVRTAAIEQRELGTTIRTVGTLSYDETRITEIHTKISGWVDQVYVDYVGSAVRRDQPLLTVYSPELVSTQNEYLLAKRYRAELEESPAATTRGAADALLVAARDRLELWDIPEEHIRELEETGEVRKHLMLHSPFRGIVLEREAFPGQYVTPEMTLFKIADLSRIWVWGSIFEYELPSIRLGQEVDIEFPYAPSARTLRGRITFIAPEIDPQTRRVRLRVELANPGLELKPEAYVTISIRTQRERRLAIPKEAVIDTGANRYALLARPNGYFEPREVDLGAPVDDFYPLLGGLAEGDQVVVSAQFLIDSESNLEAAMQSMAGMPGMEMKGGGESAKSPPPSKPPAAPPPGLPGEHQHPQ
jgi:multidrug efflux pump subunit AcrA (membrane-fusion protein)